jgi:hypothetical protein
LLTHLAAGLLGGLIAVLALSSLEQTPERNETAASLISAKSSRGSAL